MRQKALILLAVLAVAPIRAQSPTDSVAKTFFTKRDLVYAGAVVAGSGVVSMYDKKIAHWTRTSAVRGDSTREDIAQQITIINEVPLTLGAVAVYGIGRLSGSKTLTEVGLHTTEALVITVGIAELIRGPLGRLRPRSSPDDAYRFKAGRGFTDFSARAFPSIHSAVAFATAASFSEEIRQRKPGIIGVAEPLLYGAALVPGLTRMYLDQHWASDVVAGAFLGHMIGRRVVRYAHTHKPSKLDRVLLGAAIIPDASGGVTVMVSLPR